MWISTSIIWTFLYVVTITSAAVSRNLHTTTTRYTTDVTSVGLEFLKENLDSNKNYEVGEVSRKLGKKKVDFVVHKGNENHFQLKLGNRNKGLISTTFRPTEKKIVRSSIKPINKLVSPKPLKVVVEKLKNQTNIKKKVVIRPSPIKISSETLKFQNGHYRNYTKFRIKSSNKQADIIPVVSTYSPEYISTPLPYDSLQINPEISTYSPPFSVGSVTEGETQNENPLTLNSLSPASNPFGVPISQVVIQSLPVDSNSNIDTKDSFPNDCPSFLITSNLFGPQRQGCSDLSVVVNSQLSPNNMPQRQPEAPVEAAADEPVEAVEPAAAAPAAAEPVAAAPVASAAPAASPPAAAPASGGTQGANPIGGGFPMLPGFPNLSLPDLKGIFDLLGILWNGLRGIFGFLANPYLYIIPIAFSFGLGFIVVLIKFKWFVVLPALAYYGYLNRNAGKPEIVNHLYPSKVVHHDSGWFYNEGVKTYDNILQYMHPKRIPIEVPRLIGQFEEKYKK